ncbi:hypothetical protein V1639_03010 [Pseudarthrobacter sp. J75]|uniref:hypothetical protein n=1 Tax=unclassified Pseudarthrobacter TaxID=2647000 RepID=UPI002E81C00B|nr:MULTISPECIES: hypothetical protein [unclassified Pseudarthrobacter]MEE2522356.1 hypothetical protein [Pseudarthrobacter sp. J47]MEE2527998.1 hypothetical protein [Pseudarthrobacter sp. J75]
MSTQHPATSLKPTRRQVNAAVWAAPVILAAIAAPAAAASTVPNPPSTWDLKVGFNSSTLELQHTTGLPIPAGQIVIVSGLTDVTGLASTDTYSVTINAKDDGTYLVTIVTLIELYPTQSILVPLPGKLSGAVATFIGPDSNDLKAQNNTARA